MSQMDSLFTNFSGELEKQSQKKEDIQKEIRELNRIFRNIQFILQKVQTHPNDQKVLTEVSQKTLECFPELKSHWINITNVIDGENPEKYRDHWHFIIQQLIYGAAYAVWLNTHQLITIQQVAKLLAIDEEKVHLGGVDLEDYLHGIILLPRELSRLCVNCVRTGNYLLPRVIAAFVSDLYSGFRLLNLKNDALRRKFDGIKYDVQKIEEVLYDVEIRKLAPPLSSSSSSSSSSSIPSRSSISSISKAEEEETEMTDQEKGKKDKKAKPKPKSTKK